jgi:hypothetical protein
MKLYTNQNLKHHLKTKLTKARKVPVCTKNVKKNNQTYMHDV